jgi:hypothetical protein
MSGVLSSTSPMKRSEMTRIERDSDMAGRANLPHRRGKLKRADQPTSRSV